MRNGEPKCVCAPSCRPGNVKQNKSFFGVLKTVRTTNEKRPNRTVKRDVHQRNVKIHQRKSLVAHAKGSIAVDIVNSTNSSLKSDKLITIEADSGSVNGLNNGVDLQLENIFETQPKTNSGNRNISTTVLHRNRHNRKKQKMAAVTKENRSPAERHHFVDWEAKIRSGFMGYDMPYPPNDVSVIFPIYVYTYTRVSLIF